MVECRKCNEGIPLSKLFDHIEVAHIKKPLIADLGIEQDFLSLNSGLGDLQHPLKCNDLTFFINRMPYNDELMMFWISFCGTQKEAEDYEYSIKIDSSAAKKAGRTKYLFTGSRQCVSCDVSHEDMKRKMEALCINQELMRKAAEGQCEFEFKVMIAKQQ